MDEFEDWRDSAARTWMDSYEVHYVRIWNGVEETLDVDHADHKVDVPALAAEWDREDAESYGPGVYQVVLHDLHPEAGGVIERVTAHRLPLVPLPGSLS